MKKSYIWLPLLLLAATGCQQAAGEEEVKELTLAHNQPTDHPIHLSLNRFAELVEEKSDGELLIDIYPNGELGSEREVIENTQFGTVDISKVSASALEGFDPIYSIFSLPYMFESEESFKQVMADEEVTDEIYLNTTDIGFRGLTYYDAGVRNMYTKDRIIETADDMAGLKTRVQPSQTSVQMIEAIGGTPTPMSYGEVYTALQSGVIDAAENNETALVNSSHGEVAKHYFITEHAIVPDMLIMNDDTYSDLTEEEQQVIEEASEESTAYHEDVWAEMVEESVEIAKEEMGVTFYDMDKQSFIDAVQPLHQQFQEDPDTADIYARMKEES